MVTNAYDWQDGTLTPVYSCPKGILRGRRFNSAAYTQVVRFLRKGLHFQKENKLTSTNLIFVTLVVAQHQHK